MVSFHRFNREGADWAGPLDNFTIDFVANNALAAKAFENQPRVQIEITVKLPWVLSEPELT
jgi:hypothetical protein